MNHTELSSGAAIRLIASREIRLRLRSRAFLITTALLVLAVVGGGLLVNLAQAGSSDEGTTVGLTSETADLAAPLEATAEAAGITLTISTVPDEAAGRADIDDGDLDALLTGPVDHLTIVVDKSVDPTVQAVIGAVAREQAQAAAITELGGDPAAVAAAGQAAAPTVTAIDAEPATNTAGMITGLLAGILMFIALMTCGQMVAQGVVEEKTSRVVELLLATVRPWQLMAGKVLGIGLIGLGQVALVMGAGVATAFGLDLVDPSEISLGSTAAWALVWFAVGFVTYATALGASAALVSRQEDVGSVTTPVLTLMMVPYIIGVSIAPYDPDNALVSVLSYIPFCSPLLMPIRIATDAVTTWQALLALGLSVAMIPALVWLAGKIYSNAVLRTGSRVKLRDALRGA